MKKTLTLILCALCAFTVTVQAKVQEMTLTSPDGKLKTVVSIENKNLFYSITHEQTPVLAKSRIGMKLRGVGTLGENVGSPKVKKTMRTFSIKTYNYRKSVISEHCNVMTLDFGKYSVEFEAFNRGVAYRFATRMKDSLTVENEITDFVLPGDCKVYQTPANSEAKEPSQQVICSFESLYNYDNLSKLSKTHLGQGPLLAELNDGKKLLIADMDAHDYPGMNLLPADGNTLKAFFAPLPKVEYVGGYNNLQSIIKEQNDYIARTAGTRVFPWRMTLVTTDDSQLLDCDVPYCLTTPCQVKDLSWIKPGKVAWDWWNDWNLKGVNFRAGINNETYKYYIDFASRNGIPYIIMDEGWAVRGKTDLFDIVPDINLEELVAYGNQHNVGIILWAGHMAFNRDMEKVCKHFSEIGIKGFKVDFMNRDDQEVIRFYEDAARTCVKYHLVLDFHGAYPPKGLTYTYPNVLNFEGVCGLEQMKWVSKDYDAVRHETILPFARMVVGPMDYTQGAMRNATRSNYYPCNSQPMSQGTRCRQLAEYVVFDSPLEMLCDAPTSYEANQQSTDFIASVPTIWDETRILSAKVGEYIIEARRSGSTWFIGGITNWTARDITVDLSFIVGKNMTLYSDGVNADRNAEDYKCTTETVPASFSLHLAPGGGFAAVVK
jgi:alpha-glucosidase